MVKVGTRCKYKGENGNAILSVETIGEEISYARVTKLLGCNSIYNVGLNGIISWFNVKKPGVVTKDTNHFMYGQEVEE